MVDLHQPMGVAPCEMWQNVKLPVISTNLMGLCLESIPMCVYNIATMYNHETPCMEICGFKKNVRTFSPFELKACGSHILIS